MRSALTLSAAAKESLAEYGSGWEWDGTYPHVFDYTQTEIDVPMRYGNTVSTTTPIINGTWVNYGNASSNEVKFPFCDVEYSDGVLLSSGSQSVDNKSCTPHAYNAGNYYNLPSQLGDAKSNSVCPRGWRLPEYGGKTDYANFLISYGIDYKASGRSNHDSGFLNLPLSFLHPGRYFSNGTLGAQGSNGIYRMTSLVLEFNSGYLNPVFNTDASYGYSLRCGKRKPSRIRKWVGMG